MTIPGPDVPARGFCAHVDHKGRKCRRGSEHSGFHLYTRMEVRRVESRLRKKYRATRRKVLTRNGGMCEAGTPDCTFRAEHSHHLRMRSQGGNDHPDNLLAVCEPCHRFIHMNPAEAYKRGWLYRSTA